MGKKVKKMYKELYIKIERSEYSGRKFRVIGYTDNDYSVQELGTNQSTFMINKSQCREIARGTK